MLQRCFLIIDKTVQPQFLQDPFLHILITVRPVDHRILDPVIEDARRHDLLIREPLLLRLKGRVHIHRELHLQAVIQCGNIKALHPGLIVRYFHIHTVIRFIFAYIDAVDLAASELQLIPARHKVSLLQLFRKRPHRTPDQPPDPADHIFIAGRAEKDRIAIIKHAFLHARIDHFIPHVIRDLLPAKLLPVRLPGETLQGLVRDISQIHRFEAVLLPV